MSDPSDTAAQQPEPASPPQSGAALPSAAPLGVWARLKEHKVMQWTLAYAAAAYTLLHGVEMLSEAQDWPHAIVRIFSLLLIIGVPVVMTLAWYHGARAQRHVSGSELTIITLLLMIGGATLWAIARQHDAASATHAAGTAGNLPAAGDKSIAVLPFADMSEAKDQEYFADGMAEEILDLLSRIPALKVIARTSSFQFKGKATDVRSVAQQLGVSTVLEGSVRKAGNRLRITTQLIRAADGSHLWSETYDRQVDDVFRIQDEIAGAIVKRLELSLLDAATPGAAPTRSPEAHALYLQARYLADRNTLEDLDQALRLYQQAIAIDPNYAAAYARLAYCYARRVSSGIDTDGAGYANARSAAERAIALDPRLPEGYLALGVARLQYELNWQAAAELIEKARALDPNNTLMFELAGHLTQATGSLHESIVNFRHASERDPLNVLMRRYLARMLNYAGQYQEAVQVLREAIATNPGFPAIHYELGRALLGLGDRQAALAAFEAEPSQTWRYIGVPLGYHAMKRTAAANAAMTELVAQSKGSEFQVAEAYAYFGDTDQAFHWLERAHTQHDPGLMIVRRDPLLKSLERDPRYAVFLASIGLTPA